MTEGGGSVWFFNSYTLWGGAEKWLFELAQSLSQKGVAVQVALNPKSELAARARAAHIPVVKISVSGVSWLNPFKLLRLVFLMRRERVCGIVLNRSPDLKFAGLAARLAGVKHIVYKRAIAKPIRDRVSNRFLFCHIATEVIANSQETKRILINKTRFLPANRIHMIYNGIDPAPFSKLPPPIYQRKQGEIVLGNAGRLTGQKNQAFLISVVHLLRQKGLSCTLLIAGSGDMEEQLKHHANSLAIEKNVVFLGFMKDIRPFLASIDIFLLSSAQEGMPNIVMEAAAAALPVVSTATGGTPELVIDGKTGFLVPFGSLEEFADRVFKLAKDPDLREKFGRAGCQLVKNEFSQERACTEIRKLLEV